MNYLKLKYITGSRKETGSVLLVVIISMIVIAVLAVAMYTLTSTATLNQVIAQRAPRAFYLSESGIRIAASEYNTAIYKNSKLIALHNKQMTMPDNVGKITIQSNPYWFYANAIIPAGSIDLELYLPGGVPPAYADTDTALTFPTKGYLKIRDRETDTPKPWTLGNPTYAEYDNTGVPQPTVGDFNAANGGTPVKFHLVKAFADEIIIDDEFFIGNDDYTTFTPETLSAADPSLILTYNDINAATLFPTQKGMIFICNPQIAFFKYDLRIIDTASNTIRFTHIQPVYSSQLQQLENIKKGEHRIYVGRTIGFTSHGIFGN